MKGLAILGALFLVACSQTPQPSSQVGGCIGSATMSADGTITLDLIARGDRGEIGHGRLTYPPNHLQYREILEHLGGLAIGQTKCVTPWPDEVKGAGAE